MAVFGYARVGAKDPAAAEQRAEIEAAGCAVDYWYADEGISSRTPAAERPQLRRLLDQIGDGEELVVARLDRLGRDAVDVSTTIAGLATRGIRVVVLEVGGRDITAAESRPMLAVLAAMAAMERDLLVERGQARITSRQTAAARPRARPRAAVGAGRDS